VPAEPAELVADVSSQGSGHVGLPVTKMHGSYVS
jgi:hypothetical protein